MRWVTEMADEVEFEKGSRPTGRSTRTLSAQVPTDILEFIEDYRWANRLLKTDVVIEALTEWSVARGYVAKQGT